MNYRSKNNAGFSMIEVLVASTILVVIVMMLAMLFQQTSMSWRTGLRRADASMEVRSLIGAIQRDAAKAVAENSIPEGLRDLIGSSQSFGDSSLGFYTLSANGFRGDDFTDTARRALSFIEYTKEGSRTETILLGDGKTEAPISSNVKDFLTGNKNKPKVNIDSFEIQKITGAPAGSLPLYVILSADVTSEGYNLEIGAASAGPDGAWGTKDDIRTWAEE